MAVPGISVIIVTHNSEQYLASCVNSLSLSLRDSDYEVIVVDNASHRLPSPAEFFPLRNVVLLANESNRGFAAAANQGATVATRDTLLFLNPDVLLDADAVKHLLRAWEVYPACGVAGARLRHDDGTFHATCRRLPTPGNILFSRGSMLGRLAGRIQMYTLGDFKTTTQVPAIAGTVMMIRRSTYEQMHGFDERFFMYMEDTDLCARLQQSGFVNVFVPDAGGVHHWGKGSTTGAFKRNWYHHRSVFSYFLKHYPNGFTVVLLPLFLIINFTVRAVLESVSNRGRR